MFLMLICSADASCGGSDISCQSSVRLASALGPPRSGVGGIEFVGEPGAALLGPVEASADGIVELAGHEMVTG